MTILNWYNFQYHTFWVAKIFYFALMQQLGNVWYWIIQKNTSLNSIVIKKMPFLKLENDTLNSVFWVFYFIFLSGVLFFYFKNDQDGNF